MLDILFLAPGIHKQQDASNVNNGEFPTTGAMTTGYIFRVENQATAHYLQRIGKTGSLVTVHVADNTPRSAVHRILTDLFYIGNSSVSALYLSGIGLTMYSFAFLAVNKDFWAVGVLLTLVSARLINTVLIRRRSQLGWKGQPEPGVKGDLMIFLSQDRWIRMQGFVDDLKTVTSGEWLREPTSPEGFASAFATLLVYMAAALAANATTIGSIVIAGLLLTNIAILGLCNALTQNLHMFGRILRTVGPPKKYKRRLDMGEELVKETGRTDWAIAMGLIVAPTGTSPPKVTP